MKLSYFNGHVRRVGMFATCVALLCCCKVQQTVCEEITRPSQLPWLQEIVEQGKDAEGNRLLSIDKVVYYIEDSQTEGTGFTITYEEGPVYPDRLGGAVYDCDGNELVIYGGVAGCLGECSLRILSRETIYHYTNF